MRRLSILAGILAIAIALIGLSWVAVDETQYVLVTEFGRVVATYGEGQSGLHGKWPWQSALAIDRRLRVTELAPREAITGDKRNIEVAAFVVWRVADPRLFVRSAGTLAAAGLRLDEQVASALSDALGGRPLEALASSDPKVWRLDDLTAEVRAAVAEVARSSLGVEVMDVRLRRFNHPLEVRPAVFDLIRSERKKVAATLRAEGEARFQELTSEADRRRDAVLAAADAEAERIRGRGEAEAIRALNAAHARDPKFFEFLRTLETYRAILDEKATVILSASSPLLRLLDRGPSEDLLKEPGAEPVTGREGPTSEARP